MRSAFPRAGNVTLLQRPLSPPALVSAVEVCLRAAARQHEVAQLLRQRESDVRARDEFLAMLAHELRNPLAPMSNSLYVMRGLQVDDPVFTQTRAILDRQITHMSRLVDSLLDVARLERGKVALRHERLDLNQTVRSVLETFMAVIDERRQNLRLSLASTPIPIDADSIRVEQVVNNLLQNAAKFTSKGGDIHVQTAVENESGVLLVRDNGVGFPPNEAERLFELFAQVDPTIERTAGGLGIGLTIARRIAQLHGGSITARSSGKGQGATFELRLPLAQGPAVQPAPAPVDLPVSQRRRVVVVEDNADVRHSLRLVLEAFGHEVRTAEDGSSGLNLVLGDRPDAALIDIGLPGLNGFQVAQAVRKEDPEGRIRLLALTGYGQQADRAAAKEAGFDVFLLKPVDPEELRKVMLA